MPERQQPNVLIIMSDQHHPSIMGCAGDGLVRTPNLDALAAGGARMSNAHCNFPLCCPSRMSFMAARHPHEIEVHTNSNQLHSDIPTYAHAFMTAGYETLLSGRMHFTGWDQRHGFERRLIGDVWPTAYFNVGWPSSEVIGFLNDTAGTSRRGIDKSGPGRTGYQAYDEAVASTTAEFLRARALEPIDKPFMLTVGLVLPHCPFVAPPEQYHYYRQRMSDDDLPQFEPDALHPVHQQIRERARIDPTPDAEDQLRVRAAYYGMVTHMDGLIGDILEALEQSGLADNTIVVYTSDHGEQLGEHGLWWKMSFYNGSVGVPMLISWPGHITPGRLAPGNVSLMDLGPTLLDLTGANEIPGASGRSFKCLLDGNEGDWPDEVLAECTGAIGTPQRMLRRGPWKLNYYHGLRPQLFNLEEDPSEQHDRWDDPDCQQVVTRMTERVLRDWDPDEVARRLQQRREEMAMIADCTRRAPPPEPDPSWYQAPLENYIEDWPT